MANEFNAAISIESDSNACAVKSSFRFSDGEWCEMSDCRLVGLSPEQAVQVKAALEKAFEVGWNQALNRLQFSLHKFKP